MIFLFFTGEVYIIIIIIIVVVVVVFIYHSWQVTGYKLQINLNMGVELIILRDLKTHGAGRRW
jgi:hypothetical protein